MSTVPATSWRQLPNISLIITWEDVPVEGKSLKSEIIEASEDRGETGPTKRVQLADYCQVALIAYRGIIRS